MKIAQNLDKSRWDGTPYGIETLGKLEKIQNDQRLLKGLSGLPGMSSETVPVLQDIIAGHDARIAELKRSAGIFEELFAKFRDIAGNVSLKDDYDAFAKAAENSKKRRQEAEEIVVVAHITARGLHPGIKFYLPSNDPSCALEKHMQDYLLKQFDDDRTYSLTAAHSSIDKTIELELLEKESKPLDENKIDAVIESFGDRKRMFASDPVLNALGVKTEVATLIDY